MRNTLLLSAAVSLALGVPALAQTAPSPSPATQPPASTPAEIQTPAHPMPAPGQAGTQASGTTQAPGTPQASGMTPAPGGTQAANKPMASHAVAPSAQASNISPADTHSTIAPPLPTPAGGAEATPAALLRDARAALNSHRTGLAQEALERAETRLLSRQASIDALGSPIQEPVVNSLSEARQALGRNDISAAREAVDHAITLVGSTG